MQISLSSWRWRLLLLFPLFLMIVLSACNNEDASSTTPAATPLPTPTPTTVPMLTFHDPHNYYTIIYPAEWLSQSDDTRTQFTAPNQVSALSVIFDASHAGITSPKQYIETYLQELAKDASIKDMVVPSPVIINGTSWQQRSATLTTTKNTKSQETEFRVTLLTRALSSRLNLGPSLSILEIAPTKTFLQENTINFQPMLQSFELSTIGALQPTVAAEGNSLNATYQGDNYTIQYNATWLTSSDGEAGVLFSNQSAPDIQFHVYKQSDIDPLQEEFGLLATTNCSSINTISATRMLNSGLIWNQRHYLCHLTTTNGANEITIMTLAEGQGKPIYSLNFTAPQNDFHAYSTGLFEQMLQTFTFK
ncbi:hypothetical protein [Tengunoibacter tsumagoiensis]|uniref:Uncharacterized protein n=1 Tax=Tengunoibacter tsumagoiensis TaxID=2014871 RepID=A0A402A9S9_9CHLR|nr:hypothetical protein [Tengunoibacter tsumagoiensis]GCE15927.1 hypothetical protein KTT_57860 [Tengunoibacter tsumagoiensis]